MDTLIRANVLGQGFCQIAIHGETIADVTKLGSELATEPYCSPGFVDIQINGIAGVDFSAPDLTAGAAVGILGAIRDTGVTSFCPTLVTNPLDLLKRNFRVLEEARQKSPTFAASVPCYHLEGPYLSPGGAHGAHDPSLMRHPDWREFEELQEAAGGRIGILTIAPELPGAEDFIRRAARSGVLVAIGHTDALPGKIHEAVLAGARLSTHLGNGCPEFIHRHRSPIWAQLVSDELSAGMICDGFHLPAELVQAISRLKGPERCVLVTDCIHVAGLPPGDYHLGRTPVRHLATGQVVTLTTPSSMGGSTLAMNQAIARYRAWGRVPLEQAVRAASVNPARLLGERYAVCRGLERGNAANLTLWRQEGAEIRIEAVYIGGLAGKDLPSYV